TFMARPHETNGATLAAACARSPTQRDSPKALSTPRSHICGVDNSSRRPPITSPLHRVIAFFVTGDNDRNNCRATASVGRQAMCLPYKFCVNMQMIRRTDYSFQVERSFL